MVLNNRINQKFRKKIKIEDGQHDEIMFFIYKGSKQSAIFAKKK